jgi:predicted phosphodiesterase
VKYLKIKLEKEDILDDKLEIFALGDLHIGDHNCDYKLLNRQIEYIAKTPNCFVIGMGDYLNNALRLSKTDVYSAVAPQKEFQMAVEILGKIPKHKWLAMATGNHEHRTYKEAGVDLNRFLAYELDIEDRYHPTISVIHLKLQKTAYWIHIHHGFGGGSTKGGVANKMQKLGNVIPNTDIVLMGHTHQQIHFTESCYLVDKKHECMQKHTQHIINTGNCLGYQDGYAEAMALKPTAKGNAIITIGDCANRNKKISCRFSI